MSLFQILSLAGVPTLVGIIIALVIKRPLDKRIQTAEANQATQQTQSKAIMLGVQALLRDRLLQAYQHYEVRGWANYDEKQNIDNIHTQYEALGPNNVMIGYQKEKKEDMNGVELEGMAEGSSDSCYQNIRTDCSLDDCCRCGIQRDRLDPCCQCEWGCLCTVDVDLSGWASGSGEGGAETARRRVRQFVELK